MRRRDVLLALAAVCLSGTPLLRAILSGQNHQDDRAGAARRADRRAGALSRPQRLQAALGQNVIVDNRAGAGGAIGARAAATAEGDGYTIFFGNTSTLAVIPAVSKNPGYDPNRNFAPIASVSESYMILVVHPSFPAKTVQEFIAYAKANPGKLNFANAGAGNVTHLTGAMFRSAAQIDFVDVPHKGGAESVTAVLGQQVDFALESPVILLPLIREGRLRALAVTSAKRKSEIAEIPTMREGGADFVATLLTGVVAPAGTPARDRRAAQRGDQRQPEVPRDAGDAGQVRLRGEDLDAAGIHRLPGRRNAEVGRGRARRRGVQLD